MIFSESTQKE